MAETVRKKDPVVRVLQGLLRVALIALLIFYVLYHLTNGFSSELRTQTAKITEEEITLSCTGRVVRAETVVRTSATGVIGYSRTDGARVRSGAKLAVVYSGYADDGTVARIAELDRAIDLLEAADVNENTTVADGVAADAAAVKLLESAAESISRGDLGSACATADSLFAVLTRRNAILSGDTGAAERLSALKEERETLARSFTGASTAVYAPGSGYFYGDTDGLEGTIDYETVEALTPEAYAAACAAEAAVQTGAIGTLVTQVKWYFVCPLSAKEAQPLDTGKMYVLAFGADALRVKMTLVAKNGSADGQTVLAVFSALEMPADFDFARTQNVRIVTDTVSGYRIPASALRVVDGNVGVYIRSGNNIRFRFAKVLYESGSYVFISADTPGGTLYASDADEQNDLYCKGLTLYDEVIIGGARELTPESIVR